MTTTVSPSYAGEVSGHPAVSGNLHKFHGVRNGIDPEIWNPATDNFIPMKYDADSVVKGKKAARDELRSRLGLTGYGDKPVVGVISRLTAQKGIHLIKHAAHHTLSRGGQFVLLGSAPDPKVQADFNGLGAQLGGEDAGFFFAFDETLSRLMYAGCDVIVVPSMFEPCGLTQMTAMRYGTVPCVRATGGLRDTVFDVDTDKARAAWEINASTNWELDGENGDCTNGFSFEGTSEGDLDYALDRCIDAFWNDTKWFRSLQARVMRQDWTWNKPALEYIDLYYQSIGK
jgi:starch synthase